VYGIIPSHIAFFSIRKAAEKVGVVVITRFPPRVLVIEAAGKVELSPVRGAYYEPRIAILF
jgi:hypothetical protein